MFCPMFEKQMFRSRQAFTILRKGIPPRYGESLQTLGGDGHFAKMSMSAHKRAETDAAGTQGQ